MAYYLYNLSTGTRQPFTDRFTGTSTSSNGVSSFGTVRAIAFDASTMYVLGDSFYNHMWPSRRCWVTRGLRSPRRPMRTRWTPPARWRHLARRRAAKGG